MKRVIFAAAIVLQASPGSAAPNAYQMLADCQAALERGDRAAALSVAGTIIHPSLVGEPERSKIAACLTEAMGEPWTYIPEYQTFQGQAVADTLEARIAQEKARAEQEEREQKAERLRLRQEEMRLEAAEERRQRQEAERRAAVLDATWSACRSLYGRDPDAALLNAVCNPLFMAIGLPE